MLKVLAVEKNEWIGEFEAALGVSTTAAAYLPHETTEKVKRAVSYTTQTSPPVTELNVISQPT